MDEKIKQVAFKPTIVLETSFFMRILGISEEKALALVNSKPAVEYMAKLFDQQIAAYGQLLKEALPIYLKEHPEI